jgi:hypothetical protein
MEENRKQDQRAEQAKLAKEIKAMELKKRQEALSKSPAAMEQKMHFDAWHALRASSIPGHHMKEILRADFKARGLGDKETVIRYDAALAQYGVRLK